MTVAVEDVFARRTAEALVATESLLGALTPPIRVPVSGPAPGSDREQMRRMQRLLDAVSTAAGASPMTFVPAATGKLTSFEIVLASKLALDRAAASVECDNQPAWSERLQSQIANARRNSFAVAFKRTHVVAFDGATLRAYSAGQRHRPAVLIVAPCGMPAELCDAWMRALAETHFVVTAETRDLFGRQAGDSVPAAEIAPQIHDIFALLDHFRIEACHVMGICGGAVLALLAASEQDRRIRSISVWHGDLDLGAGCPRTRSQVELQQLLAMAAQGPERAQVIHQVFRSPRVLERIPADLAHLLLYPYANARLLFRYAILNGAIMRTNVSAILPDVHQPTLVVTSRDDTTAHPEGSLRVAAKLRRSTLRVAPTGDHLSLFAAPAISTSWLKSFLAGPVWGPCAGLAS